MADIEFTHKDGDYRIHVSKSVFSTGEALKGEALDFYKMTDKNHGKPDIIVEKHFEASGAPPQMYASMFPKIGDIDFKDVSGEIIELGYLQKESPHKVNRVHGDWYKRFLINNRVLYIKESDFTSKEIKVNGHTEVIKDTYKKELFEVQ